MTDDYANQVDRASTPDPDAPPCTECGGGLAHYPECALMLAERNAPDTLGPCGCTDYHMADCPTVTGPGTSDEEWYGDDADAFARLSDDDKRFAADGWLNFPD